MSDSVEEEMDWEKVAAAQAQYEAHFSVLNRRRIHDLEARVTVIEQLIADRRANGRGPYI